MVFSLMEIVLVLALFIIFVGPEELPILIRYLLKAYRWYQAWMKNLVNDAEAIMSSLETSSKGTKSKSCKSSRQVSSTGQVDHVR